MLCVAKLFPKLIYKNNTKLINAIKHIKSNNVLPATLDQLPGIDLEVNDRRIQNHTFELRLATKTINYSPGIFSKTFHDNEDLFSLHRFSWLWIEIEKYCSIATLKQGIQIIEEWLSFGFTPQRNPEIFESYSISDRLINWVFFLMFAKEKLLLEDSFVTRITYSIQKQLEHLIHNLEYHGSYTNNHIIKNAQALYICGRLLKNSQVANVGRLIIQSEYDNFVFAGVLQEDSSHYQILFTKWILEIHFAAEYSEDNKFKNWLQPRVQKLLACSRLLQGKYSVLPLFGDVSPDVAPEWLLGYPFNINKNVVSPWYNIFKYIYKDDLLNMELNSQSQKSNYWEYHKYGDYELYVIVKNRGVRCHGHDDNGSFVLFFKGITLVSDTGRFSYEPDMTSLSQQKNIVHSVPVINNSPCDIQTIPPKLKKFFSSKLDVLETTDHSFKYKITSFDSTSEFQRSFIYNKNDRTITLEDTLISPSIGQYSITLPLSSSNTMNATCLELVNGQKCKITLPSQAHVSIIDTYISPRYGVKNPAIAIRLTGKLQSSQPMTFLFNVEDSC